MKKRVIAINSSKRKRNTYGLLEQMSKQLKENNIDVDIVNLFDYDIRPCIGCEHCLRKGSCNINDEGELLMKKLTEYDGIILSSPVYMGNISGQLKVFIDRTCRWFHRPEIVGKPTLFVTTTAASGIRDTFKSLETVAIQWGAFPTDYISRNTKNMTKPVSDKEYKKFLIHLFLPREKYKLSMKQVMHFQVQKVLAEKILKIDRVYWEKEGWLNTRYFYNAKTSPISKGMGNLLYFILNKRVENKQE
ncbi:flavodoxin family protein [Serpentinicella sp. ANB-PHB4]|uniref:flavodoxin family protein n=1 Tax=Serpentinicella sp. ANB-PHB4 TaxID=3074076 RepID=UPI00285CA968|nr:flavodoxin family protein [Serpentinicella sp. ANB-PHB4]MDR5658455.1 flavodoxin family protein [Serpentinicella sp. ANB-PHB4]